MHVLVPKYALADKWLLDGRILASSVQTAPARVKM
jgi:hypothetical protein